MDILFHCILIEILLLFNIRLSPKVLLQSWEVFLMLVQAINENTQCSAQTGGNNEQDKCNKTFGTT